MEVKLVLSRAQDLSDLMIALNETEIEYTLQKAERARGNSKKMNVVIDLHDPQSLLTLLQIDEVDFELQKAKLIVPEAPTTSITYVQQPPVPHWLQPQPYIQPYVHPPGLTVPMPETLEPIVPRQPGTADPLPWDFWYRNTCGDQVLCESVLESASVTDISDYGGAVTTSVVDLSNPCTVQGQAFDGFGNPVEH
jgi:hypothetical protein